MKKGCKSMMVLAIIMVFMATGLFLPGLIRADDYNHKINKLDQIPPTWSKKLPGSKRFVLVLDDEAVLDKETGLVWARSADAGLSKTWEEAMKYCQNHLIANRKGWRLPSVEELASLLDCTQFPPGPALPDGYELFFTNVQLDHYWSSTTCMVDSTTPGAWSVGMPDCYVVCLDPDDPEVDPPGYLHHVWPVRGGQ